MDRLDVLGITCIHVVEGAGRPRDVAPFKYGSLRRRFSRTHIANNGCDLDLATPHLADGKADLIAFGRPFVANPDLVERLQSAPRLRSGHALWRRHCGLYRLSRFIGTSGS